MSQVVVIGERRPREVLPTEVWIGEGHAKSTTGGDVHTVQEKDARRGPDTAPKTPVAGLARGVLSGLARVVERELSRYLFHALAATVVLCVALSIGAESALAQEEGGEGGDAISQTLTNVRNYLAGLAFAVGGIGFVASLLVKGYASINENAHAYAAMGMKGSLWCIVAGAIVTPVLSIASGLAASGGG